MASDPLVVCLGYPEFLTASHHEKIRAIDPRIETVELAIDPGGNWITVPPADPHAEPPPWAASVGAERRAALARSEVLVALHTPADLMKLAPGLRWVHGIGAGVEQFGAAGLDTAHAVLTNSSGLGSKSMAEFTLGRMLQVWKRFREQEELQRRHEYVQTYGRTLSGCTVGIVGLGAIGRAVAERCRALGMRTLGNRRRFEPGQQDPSVDQLYAMEQLHELLAECDIVVISAPATPDTDDLIDAAALAAMKPGAMLINVARGSLVNERDLVEAVRSGHIGAAALDVFEPEPLPPESELWDLDNVYISAHSSVATDRYADEVFELFADNLSRYLAGEPLLNRVDTQALGFGR